MKIFFIYTILFFSFLQACTSLAQGGISGGGGGKGVLCGDKVYSLDLWEARQNSLLPAPLTVSFELSLIDKLKQLLTHLNPPSNQVDIAAFYEALLTPLLSKNSEFIKQVIQDIPSGTRLPLTQDATLPPQLLTNSSHEFNDCKEIQILIMLPNGGKILRDKDYWDRLPPLEQIALILHEVSYGKARKNGAQLSDEARKVVAMIMANKNLHSIFPQEKIHLLRFWCGAGGGSSKKEDEPIFEIYGVPEKENQQTGIGLYFFGFSNIYVISRTRLFLPNISMSQFLNKKTYYIT